MLLKGFGCFLFSFRNGGRLGVYTAVMWVMNLDRYKGLDEATSNVIDEVPAQMPYSISSS